MLIKVYVNWWMCKYRNGDVIQRFVPAKYAVTLMDLALPVLNATQRAMVEIAEFKMIQVMH